MLIALHSAVLMQKDAGGEPRSRYGLFKGFVRRNKSESAAAPKAFSSFRLWRGKAPDVIAESDEQDSEDEAFVSPRYDVFSDTLSHCACLV